jgi:lipopolysaccharide export LptBFGC system permease protein LptF
MAVSAGGLAVSGGGREGRGMAANAVIGMTMAFSYWAVHSLSLSVGYAGYSPPNAAAWTANALFGALAGFLLFRLRENL